MRKNKQNNSRSLAGQVRGNVQIIEKLGRGKGENFSKYRCKCLVCGKEFNAITTQLYERKDRDIQKKLSCGCDIGLSHSTNSTVNKNNTTGVKGITYCTAKGKYIASITYKRKRIYLTSSSDLESAKNVRKNAEESIKNNCFDEWFDSFKQSRA